MSGFLGYWKGCARKAAGHIPIKGFVLPLRAYINTILPSALGTEGGVTGGGGEGC